MKRIVVTDFWKENRDLIVTLLEQCGYDCLAIEPHRTCLVSLNEVRLAIVGSGGRSEITTIPFIRKVATAGVPTVVMSCNPDNLARMVEASGNTALPSRDKGLELIRLVIHKLEGVSVSDASILERLTNVPPAYA